MIIKAIKKHLRDGAAHRWVQQRRDLKVVDAWREAGRSVPPPSAFKKNLIRQFAQFYCTRVFVETGTNFGDTLASSLGSFDVLFSIELCKNLHLMAKCRFARFTNVKLRLGDSAIELPRILDEFHQPALFWLDAHYSGDGTARGNVDTPIAEELKAISKHSLRLHVVLIDDARLFNGTNSYPTIDDCRSLATRYWSQHDFRVEDDIIRIAPKEK